MQLSEYLSRQGLTQEAFAQLVNQELARRGHSFRVSVASIGHYNTGRRQPRRIVGKAILAVCAGDVSEPELYGESEAA